MRIHENPEIHTQIAQRPQRLRRCFLLPHRVGSALREAGCLMSRSREDSMDSKVGRSPRSACQHCSIREWRAEGQLWGAGRRYWSATAFITCSHGRAKRMLNTNTHTHSTQVGQPDCFKEAGLAGKKVTERGSSRVTRREKIYAD